MIGIIDYGMGNLYSVKNACDYLGLDTVVSSDMSVLDTCTKLILPGVGAFGDCMEQLHQSGLYDFIVEKVNQNVPLLGICLGMQAFFESSTEMGFHKGFGFFKGHVEKMEDACVCIPHMGWNNLLGKIEHSPYVYFVHSYYAKDVDERDLVAYVEYGNMKIPAMLVKDHIMACQFHPEKSGKVGLSILDYFGREFV